MPDLPMVVPDPSLPERVTIYEVGPRDGLQNEQAIVPVDVKALGCAAYAAQQQYPRDATASDDLRATVADVDRLDPAIVAEEHRNTCEALAIRPERRDDLGVSHARAEITGNLASVAQAIPEVLRVLVQHGLARAPELPQGVRGRRRAVPAG